MTQKRNSQFLPFFHFLEPADRKIRPIFFLFCSSKKMKTRLGKGKRINKSQKFHRPRKFVPFAQKCFCPNFVDVEKSGQKEKINNKNNSLAASNILMGGRLLPKLAPLLIILLLLFCTLAEALAQWRANQVRRDHRPWRIRKRQHSLTPLKDDELRRLARMTDSRAIQALLGPILVERQVGTAQHDAVAYYLKSKAEEFGFQTEWDSFEALTPMGQKPFHNLIATFDPLVHRRLVLACHYDSKIMPGVFLGATDSALPCALLLDIAKTLGPLIPFRDNKHITLQLLFLDGEEAFHEWTPSDSIYGARHLADVWERKWYPSSSGSAFELSREIDRIDVLVLLDLLGAKNPRIQGTYGHMSTELFENLPLIEDNLNRLNLLNKLPRIFYSGTSFAAVEDDHIPFMRRGVPIMHLISVPFPSVWHTNDDNANALHPDTFENLASIIRVFVARYLGIHPPSQ